MQLSTQALIELKAQQILGSSLLRCVERVNFVDYDGKSTITCTYRVNLALIKLQSTNYMELHCYLHGLREFTPLSCP